MMRARHSLSTALLLLVAFVGEARAAADPGAIDYRIPPPAIVVSVEAPAPPEILLAPDERTVALLQPAPRPAVSRLAGPTLRLAGLRMDPRTAGPAPTDAIRYAGIAYVDARTGDRIDVELPTDARVLLPRWSPDARHLAFLLETPDRLELWIADRQGRPRRALAERVSAAFGVGYAWSDSETLVVALAPDAAAPPLAIAPAVEESQGRRAAARTYGDLLRTPADEAAFEHHFAAQLARVSLSGAEPVPLGSPGLYARFDPSPDGRYLLVERLHRPFSYAVPAARFPTRSEIWDSAGRRVRTLVQRPLADALPPQFLSVAEGPRDFQWRSDAPATLAWLEAQDGGDPRREVRVRDRLVALAAPFGGAPVRLADLEGRPYAIHWGDARDAIVVARWWNTRREQWVRIDPSGRREARVLIERNFQARYGDPGAPVLRASRFGRPVLRFAARTRGVYLAGDGASADGERPFLARFSLESGRLAYVWKSNPGAFETVAAVLDDAARELLTRRESPEVPPQILVRSNGTESRVLHASRDPAPAFGQVTSRLLRYVRDDGVALSGTLYLPPGHRVGTDAPLPMLMWIYPIDYTDATVAGQSVDATRTRFRRPEGLSPLHLVTLGYAVLDGPTLPIVSRDGAEPNDTYVPQLVAGARAAIEAAVATGAVDRSRIAVGGHSYGAFTTANLLAHTDLFRAGVAFSGAYNRTLTPFGFQSEQRSYWQVPSVYEAMSPFAHAHTIRAPFLLVHGAADENSGTAPLQSERFFAALRGNGATARYVALPFELHRYRARESLLHAIWEMHAWLDRHLVAGSQNSAPPLPQR